MKFAFVLACISSLSTLNVRADTLPSWSKNIEQVLAANIDIRGHNYIGSVYFDNGKTYYRSHGQRPTTHLHIAEEDLRFEIGSLSKIHTAYIVWKLEKLEQLSLSDKVATMFPELTNPALQKVTLRQLITHTSCLPPDFFDLFNAHLAAYDHITIADFLSRLNAKEIESCEGKFSYSNVGYGLLGLYLERLTHQTIQQLMDHYLFLPLKMTRSSLEELPDDTIGHRANFAPIGPTRLGHFKGMGEVRSTLKDQARFFKALLLPDHQSFLTSLTKSGKMTMAYAFLMIPPGDVFTHAGKTNGFSSVVVIDKKKKRGHLALTNQSFDIQCTIEVFIGDPCEPRNPTLFIWVWRKFTTLLGVFSG